MKKEKMTMMRQLIISLLGAFLSLALLCMPAAASDLRWQPRTQAGGAPTNEDYIFGTVGLSEIGPLYLKTRQQRISSIGSYAMGWGYFERNEDGTIVYYYNNGQRVNLDDVGQIADDEANPPNGVIYYRPGASVTKVGE